MDQSFKQTTKLPWVWNYWAYEDAGRDPDVHERDVGWFHTGRENADFLKWIRKGIWNAEQATALSFGKSPEIVTRSYAEDEAPGPSLFAEYFTTLHDLVLDAQRRSELPTYIKPRTYLEWAKTNGVDFPNELEVAITESEQEIDGLRERNSKLEGQLVDQQAKIQLLQYEIDKLRGASAPSLEQPPAPDNPSAKTRVQNTLLQLLLVMAVGGYSFKVGAARQSATKDICDDSVRLNLALSDDTILTHLRAAAAAFGDRLPTEK
jgi:hypothetical protein